MAKKSCPKCTKEFAHASGLLRHQKTCGMFDRVYCPHCSKAFSRADNLKTHIQNTCKMKSRPVIIPPAAEEFMVVSTPSIPVEFTLPLLEVQSMDVDSEESFTPVSPLSGVQPFSPPKRKLVEFESSEESVLPSPKQYCCPHCTDVFRSYASHQRHVEENHAESLFGTPSIGDQSMNELFDILLQQDIGKEYSDEEADRLVNEAFDQEIDHVAVGNYRHRAREQAGGRLPLFDFSLRLIGPRRRWLNAVRGSHFQADVIQHRDPTDQDDVGLALAEALYRAIIQELDAHPGAEYVSFNITSNNLAHPYQSINLYFQELRDRTFNIDQVFRTMAGKLNSNEEMVIDDGFLIDLVVVYPQSRAGRPRKRQVGLQNLQKVYEKKHCLIKIENKDDLCVARAIVVMRAHADWKALQEIAKSAGATADQKEEAHQAYNLYDYLKSKKVTAQRKQGELARQLHADAGIPEGPCGLHEWKQFQAFLSPVYQIQVLCGAKPFRLLYQGPPAAKQINLVKMNQHMDGCSSYPAFVNKSYWCCECGRGYDLETAENHPCEGRTCKSCDSKNCPDYVMGTQPTDLCTTCNGLFYGPTCKRLHQMNKTCEKYHHCLKCSAEYPVKKKHRCYHAACPSCHEVVNLQEHKCFIQPIVDKPEPEENSEDSEKETKKPPPKPIFVYADIEAMTMPDRSFEVNLLCYRTSEEDQICTLRGKEGCLEFLNDMDSLTEVPDDDRERPVIILFHNLKGFDGLFIIHELYSQVREVSEQLTNGSKVMSFRSGPLIFKDSLCYLPMPLAAFPSTFGLSELKKGFFPHSFNTPNNQSYVGRIPEKHYYDPDGFNKEKKEKFELWHAEQERRCDEEGYVFDFQQELVDYCHSDVLLLSEGCEAFANEFHERAGFNPFENCVTIASACNEYWRRHCLPLDTIAVEPLGGWRGAQVTQSVAALQWLAYLESKIPKAPGEAKHIKSSFP